MTKNLVEATPNPSCGSGLWTGRNQARSAASFAVLAQMNEHIPQLQMKGATFTQILTDAFSSSHLCLLESRGTLNQALGFLLVTETSLSLGRVLPGMTDGTAMPLIPRSKPRLLSLLK